MRRLLDYLLAAALLGALAAAAEWMLREEMAGTARAIDGDTLVLDGAHVRIQGIDAPELHQECAREDGRPWPCGAAARRAMADLVAKGAVACAWSGRDDYDRPLARCLAGGRDLGAQMVRGGYALSFRGGAYDDEEAEARRERRGIWAGTFQRPAEYRAAHPRAGGPR